MSRNRVLAIVGIVVVVALGGALLLRMNSGGEDIFLESAASVGPNPFTTDALNPPADETTTSSPTGLYGGSTNQRVCDPAKLAAFLTSHPDKGQAWIDALNSDPTLIWSGGSTLKFADIKPYILELTPTFLAQDTRVTNHGFANGKATPHQSILQKGTAVLVDSKGVPRSRCACGNPLLPPKKVDNPHFKGEKWPGFGDQPPCAGAGCAETTTSSLKTTTTIETTTTTQGGNSTTTVTRPKTTTTTQPSTQTTTTTTPRPTTTTSTTDPTGGQTTTTCPNPTGGPNCQ